MSSANPSSLLSTDERKTLLRVAEESIQYGLRHGTALPIAVHDYPESLGRVGATFVTLEKAGELRGCIGSLEAKCTLVEDTAENAFAAAFRDPRFSPLTDEERPNLEVHVSVLGPPEAIVVQSEQELLEALRPGVDGLVLEEGTKRATFLPSVWDSLGTPEEFVSHLKRKGGWPADYWSALMRAFRYTTESIP